MEEHKKGLFLLYLATLLLHLSLYLIIPILPIYFVQSLQYKPIQISWMIGSHTLAIQIGSFISIFLCDRIRKKVLMAFGSILLGVSFFVYPFFTHFVVILIISILSGIGLGIIQPTIKASIKQNVKESSSSMAFVYRGIVANVGLLIAGLIVYLLKQNPFRFLFYLSGGILTILGILLFIFLHEKSASQTQLIERQHYRYILKNKPYILFSIVYLLLSYAYAQLIFLLPIQGEKVLENTSKIGLIWMAISLEVIVLQQPVGRFMIKRISPKTIFTFSFVFFTSGILLLSISNNFTLLLLSALIFTIGQILMAPLIDELSGRYAENNLTGAYYSFSHLVGGVGGAFGTYLSGYILESRFRMNPFIIIGSLLILFMIISYFIRFDRSNGYKSSNTFNR